MCKKSLAVKFYTVKPMYQQSSAESCAILLKESFLKTPLKGISTTGIVLKMADLQSMLIYSTYTDPAGIFTDFFIDL